MSDGLLTLDDRAAKFVPQWRDDPRRARITLRQLGSHTSGLDDAKDGDVAHDKLEGWMGEFWKRLPPPRDPITLSRDVVPLRFDPGTQFLYSNPGIGMLGYATTVAIQDSAQKELKSFLRERVMKPIGLTDADWSMGYDKPFLVEGRSQYGTWGGAAFTARAAARVVRLMMRAGNWEGRQLIKAEAVRATTSDAGTPGACGIGWWCGKETAHAALPRDAYYAAGAQDQLALALPSLNVIVVRNGGALGGSASQLFFTPLMEALAAPAR
jgi:CubicO group peptidase (beta-lactamase class C family)